MRKTIRRTIVTVLSISLLVPVVASAHPGHDHETTTENVTETSSWKDMQATLEQKKTERAAHIDTKREELRVSLDKAKREICKKHETKINDVMATMNDRRQNAFDRITKASEAVQKFYTDKKLNAEGYADALAAVEGTRIAAVTAKTAQATAVKIDCAGPQPRLDVFDFREKRAASIDAMSLYRDSVKRLITIVKETAKTAQTAEGVTE